MATITLADRILDFFNTVNDAYEIRYRIKDDPNFGSAPASGYGITLPTAQNILTERAKLVAKGRPPEKAFENIEEIDGVTGVGPATMHNILYSFSKHLRAWTASEDGQHVGSLSDVGIGTLMPEEKLEVYDGALSVRSYRDAAEQVAVLSTPGFAAYDVFVFDKHVYMVEGSKFAVFDVSDPVAPKLLDNAIPLSSYARGIFVSGQYAYVADGTSGLRVIDISDPANPLLVATKSGADWNAKGVYVVGDYAYVANGSAGLQIVDISDPANPSLGPGCSIVGGSAEDVYVAGNYAFVASDVKGLQIFDIADSASPPVPVSDFNTTGVCLCVYIHGDHAYVADGPNGFRIVDLSSPVELREVGEFVVDTPPGGQANDIFVSGNHAYVAYGSSGLSVFDISDLASPEHVDSFPAGGDAQGIFVAGNYAYVADEDLGLIVYHVLNTNRIGDNSYFGGKVGIGTEEPGARLDVAGDILTARGGTVRGVKWTPVAKTHLSPLPFNPIGSTKKSSIPNIVPSDAVEILVYVYASTGAVDQNLYVEFQISTVEDELEYSLYFYVQGYPPQNAISYNSDTFWLPITSNREIRITSQALGGGAPGSPAFTRNAQGWAWLIGYR